jgi:uncharacterized protein
MRCYLAPSEIEGLGVYSTVDIKKGDIVWKHDPLLDLSIPVSHMEASPEHVREFLDRYTYDHPTQPGMLVLDGDEGRFMNHSLTPNLDFSSKDSGIALTDIPAGTELTCNYGDFIKGMVHMQPPRHKVNGAAQAHI